MFVVFVKFVLSINVSVGLWCFVMLNDSVISVVFVVCLISCVVVMILFVLLLCLGGVFDISVFRFGDWKKLKFVLYSIIC